MNVSRIHEDPRVTKPYRDSQWQEIYDAGLLVDREIQRNDIRLSMGGEPTFVSIDDMEGEEWNGAALGKNKYNLATNLFLRLRDRFSYGSLLHYGQGKWYPGEPLPRWAFTCYWRKDGAPIWRDQSLAASRNEEYGHTINDALRFITALTHRLDVNPDYIIPAWEDPYHFIFQERKIPVNIDPRVSHIDEPEERQRLARILEKGLRNEVGFVLPLSRGQYGESPQWVSGRWILRTEVLFLYPGDSPIGYRLPLDSLRWESEEERMYSEEFDPSSPRRELPPHQAFLPCRKQPVSSTNEQTVPVRLFQDSKQEKQQDFSFTKDPQSGPPPSNNFPQDNALGSERNWGGLVSTALCIEPREGRLNIFMPPLRFLEQYLELIACIEEIAKELNLPVRIEGYPPPADNRLKQFKVTPDPGVIEVNIHPSFSWEELVNVTQGVYEDARLSRLGTEKFMLDGRHTGTNGGNHLVLGGASTEESPFLRRPDLLKSIIAYWINHPSLSYLFSSWFVGPTSQAPRVDEAGMKLYMRWKLHWSRYRREALVLPGWLTGYSAICLPILRAIHTEQKFA